MLEIGSRSQKGARQSGQAFLVVVLAGLRLRLPVMLKNARAHEVGWGSVCVNYWWSEKLSRISPGTWRALPTPPVPPKRWLLIPSKGAT